MYDYLTPLCFKGLRQSCNTFWPRGGKRIGFESDKAQRWSYCKPYRCLFAV